MKILLAIDGTDESDAAVEAIAMFDFAKVIEIRVLTVVDMALPLAHDIYSGMITNTVEIEEAARKAANDALQGTRARIEEIRGDNPSTVSVNTLVGSPESNIVEEAERFEADVIVVGSHGYNTWERLLLGSVSDSVVHHAPCSVLVVRS